MCLFIANSTWLHPHKYHCRVNVSKRDIYVYKHFELIRGHLYTPYMRKKVSANGDIMTTHKFGIYRGSFCLTVENGIHAYNYKKVVYGKYDIILRCMIPAGTPYIIGRDKDIVALQLIVPPVRQAILDKNR